MCADGVDRFRVARQHRLERGRVARHSPHARLWVSGLSGLITSEFRAPAPHDCHCQTNAPHRNKHPGPARKAQTRARLPLACPVPEGERCEHTKPHTAGAVPRVFRPRAGLSLAFPPREPGIPPPPPPEGGATNACTLTCGAVTPPSALARVPRPRHARTAPSTPHQTIHLNSTDPLPGLSESSVDAS